MGWVDCPCGFRTGVVRTAIQTGDPIACFSRALLPPSCADSLGGSVLFLHWSDLCGVGCICGSASSSNYQIPRMGEASSIRTNAVGSVRSYVDSCFRSGEERTNSLSWNSSDGDHRRVRLPEERTGERRADRCAQTSPAGDLWRRVDLFPSSPVTRRAEGLAQGEPGGLCRFWYPRAGGKA